MAQMNLILNTSIPMLKKGFPTVSDKYNVQGGILTGDTPVEFGQLVKHSGTTGFYEAITSDVELQDIAGIVLATNVKLVEDFGNPNAKVYTNPKEAFNLMIDGLVAIELDIETVDPDLIKSGRTVAVLLGNGKFTTSGADNATDLPGYTFTGIKEIRGTQLLAEIRIR